MESIVRFFLKNEKFTVMLSFGVFIFGMFGLQTLNAESYPAVSLATAIIETDYAGAAPKDIETKITKPIEDKIREVNGLKDVRSISKSGKSTIVVRVDMDRFNVDKVMADIEKKIDQAQGLPTDLLEDPKFIEVNSEEFPAIQLAVVGPNDDRKRDLIADQLKEDLEDNKKVKGVVLSGFRKREFEIRLDQAALARNYISISEVLAKIQSRNVDIPGGDLKQEGARQLVRLRAKIGSAEELGAMIIRANFSGQTVRLRDVATVTDGEEDARFLSRYNGQEATILVVNKKAGADTLELVSEVSQLIDRYQKQYEGQVQIEVFENEAQKVKNRLEILTSNALSGLVLVVVFLLIFLPGRVGVMASFSLPLAVMATFGMMPSWGMNLDAITILALVIALGMLVDNSVVISENFVRLQNEGLEPLEAAVRSVKQLALPITATALTTIGAFLPMLVTKGIMGQFIKWIPIVVTTALTLSLVEGFFLLPLRLKLAGRTGIKSTSASAKDNNDWFDGFIKRFEDLMRILVHRRYLVAVGFGGLIFVSILFMGVFNKFILFPPDQTEVYLGRFEAPRGSTLEETDRLAERLSRAVKEALGDDLASVVSKTGSSTDQPGDPQGKDGEDAGLLTIYVTEQASFDLNYKVALAKLRAIDTEGFASVRFSERENGPPVGTAINATFRSNDTKELDTVLGIVMDRLGKVAGIKDLKVDDVVGADEVFVEIDYEAADRLGLSIDSIGNAVRTAISGSVVSDVTLNNKDVDLKVKLKTKDRKEVSNLRSIKVLDPRGNLVPLSQVAKFTRKTGTPVIKRFDYKRAKTLTGAVDENQITSVEANQRLRSVYGELRADHPDVSLVFGGAEESTNESMESLGQAMTMALIAIFALMVFVFASYLRPMIIMSTIPLGLVGFSVAFALHGRPISFLALIGIVGLAGIIVNSGIVLISFIDDLRKEGKMPLDEILVKASGMRLRAVVVTSLTTVSGLFPTAYGIGGSDAILVPMTLAMAWGLTSGTVLTLLWVPCAYAILEDFTDTMKKLDFKSRLGSVVSQLQKNSPVGAGTARVKGRG
jgi:multidrug efflux pump subunit AcrB